MFSGSEKEISNRCAALFPTKMLLRQSPRPSGMLIQLIKKHWFVLERLPCFAKTYCQLSHLPVGSSVRSTMASKGAKAFKNSHRGKGTCASSCTEAMTGTSERG